MLGDVDHRAVGIAHEEAAEAPLLVGDRVDDLGSRGYGTFMHLVDVVDFDRDVGMDVGLEVQLHHAQLHFGLVGAEEEDPVEAVPAVEADRLSAKRSDRMFGLIRLTAIARF